MKTLLCNLLFIVIFLPGFPQAVVTTGKPYPVFDGTDKLYFYKDNAILSLKVNKNTVYIQLFDVNKLEQVKSKQYDDMPTDFYLENMKRIGGRYYMFYTIWDIEDEMRKLFCQEIDFDNCEFVNPKKLLASVKQKRTGFNFYYSAENSRILLEYRLKPEIKEDSLSHDIINFTVYNDSMEQLAKNEVTMPYTEKKMDDLDYAIDSEGNCYILAKVFDDNDTHFWKEDANYNIELLKIPFNTVNVENVSVSLPDIKFISQLWLYESPQGYMLCSGFYCKSSKIHAVDGILLFKLGKDNQIFDLATYEIPVEILNQYISVEEQQYNNRMEKKDKAVFDKLKLSRLLINEDGSFLLIGEKHYGESSSSAGYKGVGYIASTTVHYFEDMLIAKIDPQGKLVWMRKLPKKQRTDSGGCGFAYLNMDESHFLVFQDTKKNEMLRMNQSPEEFNDGPNGILTAFKVNDSNGEVTRIPILECNDVNGMNLFQFQKGKVLKVAPDEFVFEAYKKNKEDILIKVKLQ